MEKIKNVDWESSKVSISNIFSYKVDLKCQVLKKHDGFIKLSGTATTNREREIIRRLINLQKEYNRRFIIEYKHIEYKVIQFAHPEIENRTPMPNMIKHRGETVYSSVESIIGYNLKFMIDKGDLE